MKKIDPCALGKRRAEQEQKRDKIPEQTDDRKCFDQLPEEKSHPQLGTLEAALPAGRRIRVVCRLWLRGPHQSAQGSHGEIRQAAGVLRAVDRKEKTFDVARISPVHGRIGLRGEGHVSVRKEPGCYRQRKVGDQAPADAKIAQPKEKNKCQRDAVEEPYSRLEDNDVPRQDCKTQIAEQESQ